MVKAIAPVLAIVAMVSAPISASAAEQGPQPAPASAPMASGQPGTEADALLASFLDRQMAHFDRNGDGRVTLDEYVAPAERITAGADPALAEAFMQAARREFANIDAERRGYLTRADFARHIAANPVAPQASPPAPPAVPDAPARNP